MRKKHSKEFKFKVALTSLKGEQTVSEICQRYEVAASLVHKWKKELLESGAEIFDTKKSKNGGKHTKAEQERQIDKLYQKIGKLTIERDFLKKSWDKLNDLDD